MTTTQYLKYIGANSEFIDWIGNRSLRQAWDECENGYWMLRLAAKQKVDIRKLTLVKAKCARLVQHLMKDERSLNALDVAEKFGNGEATYEELEAAYAAAKIANANVAAVAIYAAFAASADADARMKTLCKCADICREILTDYMDFSEEIK